MRLLSIFEKRDPTDNDYIKAINNRYYCSFYYEGDESVQPGPRFVEPYCYGYKIKKSGEVVYYLRAYMIHNTKNDNHIGSRLSGYRRSVSKTGGQYRGGWSRSSGWRLFRADRIKDFYSLRLKFSYYRTGYNDTSDVAIPVILASVPKSQFKGENPQTEL